MNSIRRTVVRRNHRVAQTILVVLLIISAVALAIAIFFPTFEYFKYYSKDPSYYKFEPGARAPVAPVVPASPAPEPVATPEAAPAPEPAATPEAAPATPPAGTDATAAPEPVEGAAAPVGRPYVYVGIPAAGRVTGQSSWNVPERAQ